MEAWLESFGCGEMYTTLVDEGAKVLPDLLDLDDDDLDRVLKPLKNLQRKRFQRKLSELRHKSGHGGGPAPIVPVPKLAWPERVHRYMFRKNCMDVLNKQNQSGNMESCITICDRYLTTPVLGKKIFISHATKVSTVEYDIIVHHAVRSCFSFWDWFAATPLTLVLILMAILNYDVSLCAESRRASLLPPSPITHTHTCTQDESHTIYNTLVFFFTTKGFEVFNPTTAFQKEDASKAAMADAAATSQVRVELPFTLLHTRKGKRQHRRAI